MLLEMEKEDILTQPEWDRVVHSLTLAPRQADITWQLLHGCGDKQIAQNLGITVPTVRTHLSRLFSKLKLQGRQELVLCVLMLVRGTNQTVAVC